MSGVGIKTPDFSNCYDCEFYKQDSVCPAFGVEESFNKLVQGMEGLEQAARPTSDVGPMDGICRDALGRMVGEAIAVGMSDIPGLDTIQVALQGELNNCPGAVEVAPIAPDSSLKDLKLDLNRAITAPPAELGRLKIDGYRLVDEHKVPGYDIDQPNLQGAQAKLQRIQAAAGPLGIR